MAHSLAHLVGAWAGPVRTWLDPKADPEVSSWRGAVEALLDERYVRLRYQGECCGKPHTGEMTLGSDEHEHTMYWIDSFHTGASALWSVGPAGSVISVLGSYGAGDQRWGWRTVFREVDGQLVIEATNIKPDGQESPAIEVRLSRA
jgi:hypothetical protein